MGSSVTIVSFPFGIIVVFFQYSNIEYGLVQFVMEQESEEILCFFFQVSC